MSADNPTLWVMPDWMKQFEGFFNDTGSMKVETLMNTYGGKCGPRMAAADVELRAMVVNAQVGLLVALKGAGLLKDVPACPLSKTPSSAEGEKRP